MEHAEFYFLSLVGWLGFIAIKKHAEDAGIVDQSLNSVLLFQAWLMTTLPVCAVYYNRSKIEQTYAESLGKLAAKAQKTSKDALG